MTKQVVICDYGVGNILSVVRALEQCGADVLATNDHQIIQNAEYVILPGVGAFGHCVQELNRHGIWGLIPKIRERGTKILGICVGMQLCYQQSNEFGIHLGFGFVDGAVEQLPSGEHKIPLVGWEKLHCDERSEPYFHGVNGERYVYFVHSYGGEYNHYCSAYYELAGHKIPAIIMNNNVIATQFHPEKSGEIGLTFLKNWLARG